MVKPELDWLTVAGFKSIRELDELKLGPVNIIIGPNGSGKSNFIQVFSFLHAIRQGRLQEHVQQAGGANRVLHFGSKTTQMLKIRISFRGGINQYEIHLAPTPQDELVPQAETVFFWDKSRYTKPYSTRITSKGKEAGISGKAEDRIAEYVQGHLEQWRLYHFHDTSASSPMKKNCDLRDNRFLRPDGSNLAAFLYMLKRAHAAEYEQIVRTIQQVAPFFEDFQLEPQRLNQETIRLEWRQKKSDAYFDASSFSDGTLRFVALTTLLLQPQKLRPSVMLVDEPELGLHPYAIKLLASLIRQASVSTQVLVSTQSSLLLDEFEPEDVVVADLKENQTVFRRLETGPLKSWLRDYSLGQLWEKNELGGRPQVVG